MRRSTLWAILSFVVLAAPVHSACLQDTPAFDTHLGWQRMGNGANLAYRKSVFEADVLLKTAPPRLDEIELMRANQVLISPITLPIINADYIAAMQKKRIIALAMEYIRDDDARIFPIVRVMSEIAGNSSILIAADLLSSDRGGLAALLYADPDHASHQFVRHGGVGRGTSRNGQHHG